MAKPWEISKAYKAGQSDTEKRVESIFFFFNLYPNLSMSEKMILEMFLSECFYPFWDKEGDGLNKICEELDT